MKSIVLVLFIIVQFSVGQTIDFTEAPRNPTGFKWKKEHFNLKGDIYASDGKIFNPDGTLAENYGTVYYYKDGIIIGNNYDDTFEVNEKGHVVSFTYKSGSKSEYEFDTNNNLIYEKNSYGDEKLYAYDQKNRLIETIVKRNGSLYRTHKFSYQKKGPQLLVNVIQLDSTGYQVFNADYIYEKGMLVREKLSTGVVYDYKYDLDKKGNKTLFKSAEAGSKEFETFNRYYDEKAKNIKIELGYHQLTINTNKTLAAFINGERAKDLKIAKGLKPNEKVVYDGLTKTYYSVPDVIEENHTLDTKIPVENVLSKGVPLMSYAFDKKFINYVDGDNRVKSRDFAYLGPHMIDYRVDQNLGRVYVIENYKNNNNEVKIMQLLSSDPEAIHYLRERGEGENFFIMHKGKHIDYKNATFEYLSNGDPVISIEGKPVYVLPGFRVATSNKIYAGRFYNGELDKESVGNNDSNLSSLNTTSEASTDAAKTGNCVSGNCTNGWGDWTLGDTKVTGMFRDSALNGVAIIDYPGNSYYHGEYKNNQRDGTGYYLGADGDHYVGEWKNGKRNGYGYLMNSNNKIYKAGYFENDKLVRTLDAEYIANKQSAGCTGDCANGFGYMLYSNGDKYWGFFKNGQRHHIGYYIWDNGSIYVGDWVDGVRTGYGAYTYVDKSKFKGIFNQNKIDGHGQMTYAKSGNVVEGVFDNSGKKVKDF